MGGNPAQSKVKVVVRVRPLLSHEPNTPCACAIDSKQVRLIIPGRTQSYSFKYDSCYDIDSVQEAIYEKEVHPRISTVFEGLNTTVFAYGNTGAGKTHTMQGTEDKPGVIPRVAESMINLLADFPKASLYMSYMELYNEKLYDLFVTRGADLAIREDKAKNIFIPDLTEVEVKSLAQFKQLYENGCKHRSTGATKLNPNSSRSHAILMFKVQVQQATTLLTGKFNLIDLAGSEDNRKTGNKGIRLTESSNINQSLFVLGNVVNSLNAGSSRIPYRDSKLTRILQDSLGGSSYAVMIANIAPTATYYADTMNTLNFALKSRNITNKPTVHSIDIAAPPPVQVVAECNPSAEQRKQQLEAWKKGKGQQGNKENQDMNAQMEKLQQDMKKMQQEVEKERAEFREYYTTSFEHKMQQYLSNQISLMTITDLLRAPLYDTEAALKNVPKTLVGMTPCTQMTKIKQLLELADKLSKEWRYPQAIDLYRFIMPHLSEAHREKALNKIAFLQQCLCRNFTPGSFIYNAKSDESEVNSTCDSIQSSEDTSYESDESFEEASDSVEETPSKPIDTIPSARQPFKPLSSAPLPPRSANPSISSSVSSITPPASIVQSKPNPKPKPKPNFAPETSPNASYRSDKDMRDLRESIATTVIEENKEQSKKAKKLLDSNKENEPSRENEKAEKIEKKEKPSKRYYSSDEDYDDREERKKKAATKKTKKVKEDITLDLCEEKESDNVTDKEAILAILNNGSKKDLVKLNGVGEKRALKILEFRADNPPFTELNDLTMVVGFTAKIIASILESNLN